MYQQSGAFASSGEEAGAGPQFKSRESNGDPTTDAASIGPQEQTSGLYCPEIKVLTALPFLLSVVPSTLPIAAFSLNIRNLNTIFESVFLNYVHMHRKKG